MLYTELEAGNHTYKLRINTRSMVQLEERLGANPLAVFNTLNENDLTKVTDMVVILHAALQPYNHGITMDDTYTIFDQWLDDGHTAPEFLAVILDVYRVSGLIKREEDSEKN